jgi:TolA-binding protein
MTMTATMMMASAPSHSSSAYTSHTSHQIHCPNCGHNLETESALQEARARIADLEAQVRLLNQKATAAVDRWADYEDELSRLRAASIQSPTTTYSQSPSLVTSPRHPSPTRSSFLPAAAATRLSQLLSPRKSTPNLRYSPPPSQINTASPPIPSGPLSPTPSTATTEDLLDALSREQKLRLQAESRLSTTSKEVEELSVSLFEQANEMVATERRARAKLEERIEVLEKRDADKRRRFERLEMAMGRIERVKALLAEDSHPQADLAT